MMSLLIALHSSSSGGQFLFLLAGPAAAIGVYWWLFQYYRNTDKSHSFEHETKVGAKPVAGNEQKVDEVHGTQRSTIDGDNVSNYRQRVQRV
ncbi:MAG: hypothetical protein K4304_05655 [Propionicimonas sp.]